MVYLKIVEKNMIKPLQNSMFVPWVVRSKKPMSIRLWSKIILENSFIECKFGKHPPCLSKDEVMVLKFPPTNKSSSKGKPKQVNWPHKSLLSIYL